MTLIISKPVREQASEDERVVSLCTDSDRLTGTKRASVRGLEDQRRPHQESKTTDALRPSDLLIFIDFQQPQQLGQAHALTGTKL